MWFVMESRLSVTVRRGKLELGNVKFPTNVVCHVSWYFVCVKLELGDVTIPNKWVLSCVMFEVGFCVW